MPVVAVVSAVVALVLLMMLLQSRGALASTNEALASSERKADAEARRADEADEQANQQRQQIESLEAEIARLESELAETTELADERAGAMEAERTQVADLQEQLDEAVSARNQLEIELTERASEVAAAEASVSAAEAVTEAQEQVNLTLTHENESLQEQLVVAADEAAKRSEPSVPSVLVSNDGEDLDVPGFSPAMAWDLELVRSERTWRYSVAANPVIDPNPFENTENPLKLAIEIEALALREDVGAFIGIDWRAGTDIDPISDPARAHLTLRLAQELLASAARELSPSTLIVTSDASRGGVSLEVVASDPDDVDFKIPPPPIASEWIGIDEHGGMVVTVRVN